MSPKRLTVPDPPEVIELFASIASLYPRAKGFEGVVLRCVAMRYATKTDFYSGTGAAKAGGRWNRKGILAIYAALDIHTAIAEAYQGFKSYGFATVDMQIRATAGARARFEKVLDLTKPSTLKSIGFSKEDLVNENWRALQDAGEESWTQAIGRGAVLAGFEALIAPSAVAKKSRNIVIFQENLKATSTIEILGAADLPG